MEEWETLEEKLIFQSGPYVRIFREVVRLPDGRVIDDFHQVFLRSYVEVVAVTEDGRIPMIRHYKHGPRKVGWSFPAGFIETGDSPEVTARRELLEETGCVIGGELVQLGHYVDNGNQRGSEGYQFLATGCRQVQPPDSGDLEEMEVHIFTVAEVDALLRRNAFSVSHDVAAWGLARVLRPDVFGGL